MENIKEKLISRTGSVSGIASILGSWQVCHNICLGLIALLSLVGITIVGMPLLFLTKIAVPIWLVALGLLLITLFFYFKKHCISKNLILFNTGVIIAGTPFAAVQKFNLFFWVIGGAIAISGISLWIKDKIQKKRCKHEKK